MKLEKYLEHVLTLLKRITVSSYSGLTSVLIQGEISQKDLHDCKRNLHNRDGSEGFTETTNQWVETIRGKISGIITSQVIPEFSYIRGSIFNGIIPDGSDLKSALKIVDRKKTVNLINFISDANQIVTLFGTDPSANKLRYLWVSYCLCASLVTTTSWVWKELKTPGLGIQTLILFVSIIQSINYIKYIMLIRQNKI